MKELIPPGPSSDRAQDLESAKHNKELINWIFEKYEKCSERYIESERFLIDLVDSNFILKLLIGRKVNKFIKNQLKKYKF